MTIEEQLSIINKFMEKYVKTEIPKLNKKVVHKDLNPGNIYHTTILNPIPQAWEKVDLYGDGKLKQSPIAGHLKDGTKVAEKLERRLLFGYCYVSQICNKGYDYFKEAMDNQVKVLIMELISLKGFGPDVDSVGEVYLTFKTFGDKNLFVEDLENSAAFEIRAYCNCVENFELYKG